MIIVTVTPREEPNLFGLLQKKELALRREDKGTLHRAGKRKSGGEKWTHARYNGSIRFQKCLGGVVVAQILSKSENDEWQLLQSFIGFLYRHFRTVISNISLSYNGEQS